MQKKFDEGRCKACFDKTPGAFISTYWTAEGPRCVECDSLFVAAPTDESDKTSKASDVQVGGGHYKNMAIQPYQYCELNKLSILEGGVVKYISRYKEKNGEQDLDKAIHCIELLKELHYGNSNL